MTTLRIGSPPPVRIPVHKRGLGRANAPFFFDLTSPEARRATDF